MKMNVYRKPIANALEGVLNLISLGTFTKAKEQDYDKLFHLGLFCVLNDSAGRFVNVLCEKNATIEITRTTFNINEFGETKPIHIKSPLTLNKLLEGGQSVLGQKYFVYDPFESNCQMFVRALLQGSGLYTEDINKFVFQSVESIVKAVPSYVPKVARTLTDLGGIWDHITGGKLTIQHIKINGKMPFIEARKHARSILKTKRHFKEKMVGTKWHFKNIPKSHFKKGSFRSKKINDNITLVFGELL
jgi:hypothetical protein